MRRIVFEQELSYKQQARAGTEQLIFIMAKG